MVPSGVMPSKPVKWFKILESRISTMDKTAHHDSSSFYTCRRGLVEDTVYMRGAQAHVNAETIGRCCGLASPAQACFAAPTLPAVLLLYTLLSSPLLKSRLCT